MPYYEVDACKIMSLHSLSQLRSAPAAVGGESGVSRYALLCSLVREFGFEGGCCMGTVVVDLFSIPNRERRSG